MKTQALARLQTAFNNPGQDMDGPKMLAALSDGLRSVLEPFGSKEIPLKAGKFKTLTRSGKPKQGAQVLKLLKGLDYVVSSYKTFGLVAGIRDDRNGVTIVHYENQTGVTTVTSTLPEFQP